MAGGTPHWQSRQTTDERTLTFALSNFELQEGRQAHTSVWSNVHVPWNAFHGKHVLLQRHLCRQCLREGWEKMHEHFHNVVEDNHFKGK